MAFQVLHFDGTGVVKHNCFTLKQIKSYIWGLNVHPSTIITVADLSTMESVHGNRKTFVKALNDVETTAQIFER